MDPKLSMFVLCEGDGIQQTIGMTYGMTDQEMARRLMAAFPLQKPPVVPITKLFVSVETGEGYPLEPDVASWVVDFRKSR